MPEVSKLAQLRALLGATYNDDLLATLCAESTTTASTTATSPGATTGTTTSTTTGTASATSVTTEATCERVSLLNQVCFYEETVHLCDLSLCDM